MGRSLPVLVLLVACQGAESHAPTAEAPRHEAAEAPQSEQGAPEPAPEAEPEAEPAFFVAERPAPFFLVDDCHGATGADAEEALRACRRLARDGRPHLRRACDCRREKVLAITLADPVAFHRACCWAAGDTPEAAHAECRRRVDEGWCEPEDPRRVDAVTGPYERPGRGRLYEDVATHRYFAWGPAEGRYEWVDRRGEPPCFAAGTPVATPRGPVPIEQVAAGDEVLTLREGRLSPVPVIRVRQRRVARLLAVTVGGRNLRVTGEHPLRVGERWVPARELRLGDRLQREDGFAAVEAIALEEGVWEVHSLRVGAPHTYLAGGVLAHNY